MTARGTVALAAIPLAVAAGEALAARAAPGTPLHPWFAEPDPRAFASIAAGLVVATFAYLAVLRARTPPSSRDVVVTASATLLVALASPVIFSADARAYVAYGETVVRGGTPFRRVAAEPPNAGPALRAALHDWHGRLPADVYGPAFTALAALAVLASGDEPDAARALLRALAVAAWFATVLIVVQRNGARAGALVGLHPVVLWTVAEGHNDALWLAPAVAAFAPGRAHARTALLTLAAAIKAVAVVPLVAFAPRRRELVLAVLVVIALYAPLAVGVATERAATAPGAPRLSPLALLLHPAGAASALALAIVVATVALVPRAWRSDPAGTAVLAAWTFAPVAYPWYAAWLVPLVAARPATPARRALFAASLVALAGYVQDAVTTTGAPAFSVGVMVVQYAVPLVVLALALAQATPAPQAESTPATHPAQTPVPAGAPAATPVAQPTTAPATPPPASPTPNPYTYVVVPTAAPDAAAGAPRILEVAVNDRVIHAGGPLLARVTTSADTTACVARLLGRELALVPAGAGVYLLNQQLPSGIPFWFLKDYDVEIVTARADGASATAHIRLRLSR